jgi:hypothetical protein
MTRECACDRAGISRRTFCRWLSRGKKSEEPFATFLAEVKAAEATVEAEMVQRVRDAAVSSWQAAAWWLAHKFPASWSDDREAIQEIKKLIRAEKKKRTPK